MTTICMAGACGRMGRRILELAATLPDTDIGGAFDLPENTGREILVTDLSGATRRIVVGGEASSQLVHADVLIDFTLPDACMDNVRAAMNAGKPAVIGTTGLNGEQQQALRAYARETAIVYAPNMSVGVNLLFKLTREVAALLGPEYNVEIVELHHNQKKDSPSGTAVRLAECAAEGLAWNYPDDAVFGRHGLIGARPERQIGVHALRGGDVVGEHTVSFIGGGERIELTHKAHNRDNFARGALRAAHFAVTAAPGLYDMQDVLGLK